MELLVSQMVQIDAEISLNCEDDEDDGAEGDLIFQLEEPQTSTSTPSNSTDAANKLDALMTRFFNYLNVQLSRVKSSIYTFLILGTKFYLFCLKRIKK